MTNYAAIKDNKVVNVLVFDNPTQEELTDVAIAIEVDLIISCEIPGVGIGSDYINGELRSVQPYPSWTWNSTSKEWEAPNPKPTDDKDYTWNEDTKSWDVFTFPTE